MLSLITYDHHFVEILRHVISAYICRPKDINLPNPSTVQERVTLSLSFPFLPEDVFSINYLFASLRVMKRINKNKVQEQ